MSFSELSVGNLKVKALKTNVIKEYAPGEGITINGNLTVEGTLTKVNTINTLLKDNYIFLGSGFGGGIVINVSSESLNIVSFINNVVTISENPNYAKGTFVENDGNLYEVDFVLGNVITLRTKPAQPFTQKVIDLSLGKISKVTISVIRSTLGFWETACGDNADTLKFIPMSGGASLQSAYNTGSLITKNKDPIVMKGNGEVLKCVDDLDTPYFKVTNSEITISNNLVVGGLVDPIGLQLTPSVSNPGNAQTLWVNDMGNLLFGNSKMPETLSDTSNYVFVSGDRNFIFSISCYKIGPMVFINFPEMLIPNCNSICAKSIPPIFRPSQKIYHNNIVINTDGEIVITLNSTKQTVTFSC